MASSVVVKVKYGDTLRRFNAPIDENKQIEFDIEGLSAKIRSLFNFTADAELKLTYVDEDSDIVALVDEEDLCDVVRQGLNPVRITVQLKTGKAGSASSGSSTPFRLHGDLSQYMNAPIADLMKSVPEPFREPLSKLSAEVNSKAATTPILAEIIDSLTKAGQSFLNGHPPPQSDVAASKDTLGSMNASMLGKDVPASGNEKSSSAKWKAARSSTQSGCGGRRNNKDIPEFKRKHGRSVIVPEAAILEECTSSGKGIGSNDAPRLNKSLLADSTEDKNMRSLNGCPFSGLPMRSSVQNPIFPLNSHGTEGAIFHKGVRCDGCGVLPITGPRFKSKVKDDYDLCRICYQQMGSDDADYKRIDIPATYFHPWSFKGNPLVKSQPWAHPAPSTFTPPQSTFTPPHLKRFMPKLDSRFILDVNVMDGTIMAPKTPFTKIWRMRNNGHMPWTHGTQMVWIGGDQFSATDSVEIEVPVNGFYPENEVDVAVDFVSPELPGRYISYWKMASQTGQRFGQRIWVLIQVDTSLSDVAPAAPLDVAPAAPLDVASTVPNSLNLNLPPEGTADNLPQTLDVEPLVDVEFAPSPMPFTTMMQKPLADEQQQINLSFPDDILYNAYAFGSASSSSAPPVQQAPHITNEPVVPAPQISSPTVKYPTLNLDHLNQLRDAMSVEPVRVTPTPTQVNVPIQTETANSDVEELLLKELEEMGFKMVSLNKEVLRKNEYNLEQSLDELCNVNEWDLLLEELQGMGFVDREMNKRVLEKNKGSLKHAVMDLITREGV